MDLRGYYFNSLLLLCWLCSLKIYYSEIFFLQNNFFMFLELETAFIPQGRSFMLGLADI